MTQQLANSFARGLGYAGLALIGSALLGSLGCGSDSGDDNGNNGTPDAAGIDAEVNTCTVLEADYGALGAKTGSAVYAPQDDLEPLGLQFLTIRIPLNADALADELVIELFEDALPFDPDLEAGSFPLTEDQTSIIRCGTCVYIAADFQDPNDVDFHVASSGSMVIDTLDLTPDTGSVTGSLSDVNMRKIELANNEQNTVAGGCKTHVESVTFDFAVTVPSTSRSSSSSSLPSLPSMSKTRPVEPRNHRVFRARAR